MAAILRRLTGVPARQMFLKSQRACISTQSGAENSLVKRNETVPQEVPEEEIVRIDSVSGLPRSQVDRLVRIYMPARNAMQSGSNNTHKWKLTFENQERWENPLIGWTSTGDPLSNVSLSFRTEQEAISFALRHGWRYQVSKPNKPEMRSKSYGENFSWDKRTRVGSK